MKTRPLAIPAMFVLLGLMPLPPMADELLHFKSGYEMMVVSHREDKDMIIAKLEGGDEVGFPKDSLDLLELGRPSTRTRPSPLYNKVHSRVTSQRFMAPKEMPSRILARGAALPNGATVGYSKNGKPMQRFSGGPLAMVNPNGKIGIDIRTQGKIRNHNAPADEQATGEPVKMRTLDAIVPSSREGD